jgi:D-alanyl-D-alanine carboxypeptidase
MTLFSSQTIITSAIFSTLMFSGCSGGSDTPIIEKPPGQVTADYQALIDSAVSDVLPGIVLRVESPKQSFLGSAGLSNVSTFESLESYHQTPTASAGKPMVSLLANMLHEDGQLNLDDSLDHWLAAELVELIPYGVEITLRQLLNHTSGIYNYTEEDDFIDMVFEDPTVLRTDIDFIPFGLNHSAYFAPGKGYEYSNTGYHLAGLILDQVLGYHHSVELRSRILEPLAMLSTYYKGVEKSHGDFVSGYVMTADGEMLDVKALQENLARANAPVVSTVEDLAVFLKSLIDDDSFVSDAIKETMFGEQSLISVGNYEYGLGIHRQTVNGQKLYFHNGQEHGYSSYNVYIPETETSISATFNCGGYDQCELAIDTLMDQVLVSELKQ